MAHRAELTLLLLSGRLFLGTARDEEALASIRRGFDWLALFRQADSEGMSGLVALQLQRLAGTYHLDLPLAPFSRALHGIFAHNGAALAELAALRQAMGQQRLQAILLKGGALLGTIYRRHPGVRPLSDLDLLVKAVDLPAIKQVLLERGYRPESSSSGFFVHKFTSIDLHTDLIGATRITRRALAFQFDPETLWREATAIDPHDPTLLRLAPVQQFMHLAVHILKHSFGRLIWLVDLALVWQSLRWEDVVPQAVASGTLRPVAYVLWCLDRLLGVEVPPHVWAALPRLSKLEKLFLEAVAQRRDMVALGEVMVAFSIPTWPRRLGYLREFSFPQRHVLAEVFPTTPAWLVYPRRLSQLCTSGLRESGRSLLALGKRR